MEANFTGESIVIRSDKVRLGMVVIVSRFTTQGLASPSSAPNRTSVWICRIRVVTGATVTRSRTA